LWISQTFPEIWPFLIFQDGGRPILDFKNFEILTCCMSRRASLRHCAKLFGFVIQLFQPPTKSIWWTLSLGKIWLELVQQFPYYTCF